MQSRVYLTFDGGKIEVPRDWRLLPETDDETTVIGAEDPSPRLTISYFTFDRSLQPDKLHDTMERVIEIRREVEESEIGGEAKLTNPNYLDVGKGRAALWFGLEGPYRKTATYVIAQKGKLMTLFLEVHEEKFSKAMQSVGDLFGSLEID